jgi:potassium-dependent mechanosensitive channel
MVLRQWIIACFVLAAFGYTHGGAIAQTATPSAAQPVAAAPAQPAKPAAPQINVAEITKRANDSVGVDIQAHIKGWQKELDRFEEVLRKPNHSYSELNGYRDQLLKLRADGEDLSNKLQPPQGVVEEQVQKLPALPAQDQAPEPEQVAQLRAGLNYHLGLFKSARSSIDAQQSRINELLNTIQDIRRKNFTSNLFQPVPGVFSSQTWENVSDYASLAETRVEGMVKDWWNSSDKPELRYLILSALAMALVLGYFRWHGVERLRTWSEAGDPPFWRRASSAAGVILMRSMPVVLPIVFLYNAIDEMQPFPDKIGWLFYVAARSLFIVVVVNALMTTVLSPRAPEWRLIPAGDRAALRITRLVLALVILYGLMTFVYSATRTVQSPFSLTLALTLPGNLLVAALVVAILKTPLEDKDVEGMPSLTWLRLLRLPLWGISLAIVVTAFAGYLALSRFIAQQLIVTGSILALVYLLLLWADGYAQGMRNENSAVGSWLKGAAALDQDKRERLSVPVSLLLKLAVLVASVPLILLQWGYPWPDIIELYRQLFFGFRIGTTEISLAAIFASIIVFVLGYFAAKLFQGWLDRQVLKPAGLSGGLRDSIRTTVGYAGIFAAALLALSYAGFNLSNIAIVAGALSVGIGLGLQAVVSNFVSGLILLAERPIKIGDLVTVGGEEGYVRKISVRSTEIETFERANVLIPNSSFITDKVKNWTLRNNTARTAISVAVAHGSDPRLVKALLLKVAQDHLNVMTSPEPFVDFEDFNADSLNFKLYIYIYDLSKGGGTRTDLRIGILEAFKANDIALPSHQTEVLLHEVEWLRDAVSQYMASPANGHVGNGSRGSASVPGKGKEALS